MLSITYEEWCDVCWMYFNEKPGRKKSYLQWYPFVITKKEKKIITSENFFKKYVKTGLFLLNKKNWLINDNYMQKSDGSLRFSTLVSPNMFLLFQCIGTIISKNFTSKRQESISVFYAGNLDEKRCFYAQDYDEFYKLINLQQENYSHFIKTDIRDFFNNINVNILFQIIERQTRKETIELKQKDLLFFKEFVLFCGKGRFPLLENSVASSYLATVVYLDNIDFQTFEYLDKFDQVLDFQMIRYVDDLYILFNPNCKKSKLTLTYNNIINTYSSILKKYELSLNLEKCTIKKSNEISEELKKSNYDEIISGNKKEISKHGTGNEVSNFVSELYRLNKSGTLTAKTYFEALNLCFKLDNIQFIPSEVFNYYLYENKKIFKDKKTIQMIRALIRIDITFISIEPKKIVSMLMNTGDTKIIEEVLKELYYRYEIDNWNVHDTAIAINYLLKSKFENINLLKILKDKEPSLYNYNYYFCKKTILYSYYSKFITLLYNRVLFIKDIKLMFLYSMYKFERNKGNYLAAFAYYKSYFDRFSAHIAFASDYDNNGKCPNYKNFYKEKLLINFYKEIEGSKEIICEAHRYRNSNPLAHSSAELIDAEDTKENLKKCIRNLNMIVIKKIKNDFS